MRCGKIVHLLFFTCFSAVAMARTDTLHINGSTFITVIKVSQKTEYGKRDTLLDLYRLENGKPKYLLQHTLYSYGADCNNEVTTKGTYKIQHDSIIFTSIIQQKTGLDPLPDAQQQIYTVDEHGKLRLIACREKKHRSGTWTNASKAF